MIDDAAKSHLHDQLRWIRDALVWKLDGLSEYDVRRPLTVTGTNLLGLVKHTAIWDSRDFGEVFGRPFPEDLPRWTTCRQAAPTFGQRNMRVAPMSSTSTAAWSHTDSTIEALDLDTVGHVPWWHEDVPLFNVMVHCLSDTTRHAGHADILREGLDGAVGVDPGSPPGHGRDDAFWEARRGTLERIAVGASCRRPSRQPHQRHTDR